MTDTQKLERESYYDSLGADRNKLTTSLSLCVSWFIRREYQKFPRFLMSPYFAPRFYPAIMATTILPLSLSLSSFWVGCSGLPTPACGGRGLEPNKTRAKKRGPYPIYFLSFYSSHKKTFKNHVDPWSPMCFKMSVYVQNEKQNLSLPFSYSQY